MTVLIRGLCFLAITAGLLLWPAAARSSTKKLLVLGDSLSAGYGLSQEGAFPSALERALILQGIDVRVLNAGVSGDTASGGLARIDWALAERPDAVIVELGANDMLRGIDPNETYKALDAIMSKLKGLKLPVLIAGMLAAPGLGSEYETRFNAIFPDLAKKHDVILYPFFLQGVVSNPKLLLADGMHPNRQGVEEIVRLILPHVNLLLSLLEKGK